VFFGLFPHNRTYALSPHLPKLSGEVAFLAQRRPVFFFLLFVQDSFGRDSLPLDKIIGWVEDYGFALGEPIEDLRYFRILLPDRDKPLSSFPTLNDEYVPLFITPKEPPKTITCWMRRVFNSSKSNLKPSG